MGDFMNWNIENIGWDLDGVLFPLDKYQFKYGGRFLFYRNIVNPNAYDLREIYNCSKLERNAFWLPHFHHYCMCFPAWEGVKETINELYDEQYSQFLVTARYAVAYNNPWGWLARKATDIGLERNGLDFADAKKYYVSEKNSAIEKRDSCEELRIAFMWEDLNKNIKEIRKVVKHVLVPAMPWNEDCEQLGDNITRIWTPNQGAEIIRKLSI